MMITFDFVSTKRNERRELVRLKVIRFGSRFKLKIFIHVKIILSFIVSNIRWKKKCRHPKYDSEFLSYTHWPQSIDCSSMKSKLISNHWRIRKKVRPSNTTVLHQSETKSALEPEKTFIRKNGKLKAHLELWKKREENLSEHADSDKKRCVTYKTNPRIKQIDGELKFNFRLFELIRLCYGALWCSEAYIYVHMVDDDDDSYVHTYMDSECARQRVYVCVCALGAGPALRIHHRV